VPHQPLTTEQAADLLADPAQVEALATDALLVVDTRAGGPLPVAARLPLAGAPCVTVALAEDPAAPGLAAFDVVLLEGDEQAEASHRHVATVDAWAALDQLSAAVAAQPRAALVAVQVLRATAVLPVPQGLVVESLAYSTLQSGPDFAAWRATRAPREPRAAEGPAVLVERTGGHLELVLNRPAVHNAYSVAVRDALVEGLELATVDPGIESVGLSGRGPSFSSGGDLTEFGTFGNPAGAHVVRTTRSAGRLLAAVGKPVRARAHGSCRGAGVELTAFATEVVAAAGTTFALPEVAMGLVPGAGGTVSLPRRIGRQRTAWLALTGQVLDAARATRWGLVDRLD